jgi:hypothetical protein
MVKLSKSRIVRYLSVIYPLLSSTDYFQLQLDKTVNRSNVNLLMIKFIKWYYYNNV